MRWCRRGRLSSARKHTNIAIVRRVRRVSHHIFCKYNMDVTLHLCIVIQMLTEDWYVEFEDWRKVSCWKWCDVCHVPHCRAIRAWWRAPISDLAICGAHDFIHHELTPNRIQDALKFPRRLNLSSNISLKLAKPQAWVEGRSIDQYVKCRLRYASSFDVVRHDISKRTF